MMIVKFELIKSTGRELGYNGVNEKKLLQFFRSKEKKEKKNKKHFIKFRNSILLSINICFIEKI